MGLWWACGGQLLNFAVFLSFQSSCFKRLGFSNPKDPLGDFEGQLNAANYVALEFMRYFAETYNGALQNIISDEKSISKSPDYLFPFAKSSIAIVRLVYELLEINKMSNPLTTDHLKDYQLVFVLFYHTVEGLYEFFSNCVILFYKLWTDMKAQRLDFNRALLVFKDSLIRITNELNNQAKNEMFYYKKIERFFINMRGLNYDKIKIPNLTEKLNKPPFRQLKQILADEVMAMIRPKRTSVLCKGDVFYTKTIPKGSDKKGNINDVIKKMNPGGGPLT